MQRDESRVEHASLWARYSYLIFALVMATVLAAYMIPELIRHGARSNLSFTLICLFLMLSLLSKWMDTIGRRRSGRIFMIVSLVPGIGMIITKFVFEGAKSLIPLVVIIVFFAILIIAGKIQDRNSS